MVQPAINFKQAQPNGEIRASEWNKIVNAIKTMIGSEFDSRNMMQVRIAMTYAGPTQTYPTQASNPNIFPIKFLSSTIDKTPGARTLRRSFLRPGDDWDTGVLNLGLSMNTGTTITSAGLNVDGITGYIPKGLLLTCFLLESGVWATMGPGPIHVKVGSGGISARTGSGPWTLGSGSCTYCEQYAEGGVLKMREVSPSVPITIYNNLSTTISAGKIVACHWLQGCYQVVVGDC